MEESEPKKPNGAETKKQPEPRRAGQVVERGKDKWLIRVFVGKDASDKGRP